ncbi:MAG TPA: hypothetical protein VK892_16275 [Pyrinomonadaceae bacterium]|nr:hypothetical protein [Pyrinomonadaceae bacterium]
MATVSYAFFSWTAVGASNDLLPGQEHQWSMWGGDFNYGDAIMVTAHPVTRQGINRALAVEKVKISNAVLNTTLSFVVKNVGTERVPGYGLGFDWVDR